MIDIAIRCDGRRLQLTGVGHMLRIDLAQTRWGGVLDICLSPYQVKRIHKACAEFLQEVEGKK